MPFDLIRRWQNEPMVTATDLIQEIIEVAATEGKPKVALDTCCVQYYISNPPVQPWADCLDPIFRAGLEGKVELYVSTVVISELLAQVHYANRHRVGYDPELDLLAILNRHFHVLDVNSEVARAAGRLRGNYVVGDKMVLKTPDALIGATSLANGHTLFVTNDAQLARALPDGKCIYLRDLALDWLAQNFSARCLDSTRTVTPSRSGSRLLPNGPIVTPELGSIQPDSSANWRRILADAFTAASALNEPCIFFVLTRRNGRKMETVEVVFWHEGLEAARPATRIVRRAQEHLGYSPPTGKANNANHEVFVFCFTSMNRERARQSQTCFASKSDHQKQADAWDSYLRPLWCFRSALTLPQTTWLLWEDGVARYLKPLETSQFLDQAKNVLGWEGKR